MVRGFLGGNGVEDGPHWGLVHPEAPQADEVAVSQLDTLSEQKSVLLQNASSGVGGVGGIGRYR